MSETTIHLETLQPQHTPALIELLIFAFRDHFKQCQNLSDEQLTHLFEKRLESASNEVSTHRIVALEDDKVVGTLCLKWKPESEQVKAKNVLFSKEMVQVLGKWEFFKFALSSHLLKHDPALYECYIADIAVHPEYQAQGIEERLIPWVCDFAKKDAKFDLITLHVKGTNKNATRLYEKFFFKTCLQKRSFARSILFGDPQWNYMTLPLK
jgi:GNAT superfamily N-acetyltransferase